MTPTTQAIDKLHSRLQRIHTACMDTRPKQAVGEMIEVMLGMPEWAELAIPQEVTAPNLTPEMRESLNSRLSDHWYGCADEVWRLIWATTNTKHAQPIGGKVTQIKSTHRKLRQAVECLEILNQRPRPMCRDCGDSKVIGVCDNNGLACDMPTLIKDAKASLKALAATSTKPADSAAVQAEPVAYSITTNGEHTGNFFTDEQDTRIVMKRLNDRYPENVRKIEPLFTTPQAPTAQPVAPGWQSIETAPKDGTELLLRSKNGRHADGAWIAVKGSKGYWAWALVKAEPTHWMPLPVAPSMPPKEGV